VTVHHHLEYGEDTAIQNTKTDYAVVIILTRFRIFALSRGLNNAITALKMAGGFTMCIWATRSG